MGKWRYKVPGPTSACLAMSSKLVSAPDLVKACFATSRMRSRFRCASARGLRAAGLERLVDIKECNRRHSPLYRSHGGSSISARSTGKNDEVIGVSLGIRNVTGGRLRLSKCSGRLSVVFKRWLPIAVVQSTELEQLYGSI